MRTLVWWLSACCARCRRQCRRLDGQLAQIAPHAAVHIIEPSTSARSSLLQRFRGCEGIRFHHQAVSDYTGEAKLHFDSQGSPLASLSLRELGHLGINMDRHETVAVTRLDELWPHFGANEIDWVKLDVEGHELSALRGLGARLANVRLIQFEFGGCNLDTRTNWKDFWSFFTLAGWQVHRISPQVLDASKGTERLTKPIEPRTSLPFAMG